MTPLAPAAPPAAQPSNFSASVPAAADAGTSSSLHLVVEGDEAYDRRAERFWEELLAGMPAYIEERQKGRVVEDDMGIFIPMHCFPSIMSLNLDPIVSKLRDRYHFDHLFPIPFAYCVGVFLFKTWVILMTSHTTSTTTRHTDTMTDWWLESEPFYPEGYLPDIMDPRRGVLITTGKARSSKLNRSNKITWTVRRIIVPAASVAFALDRRETIIISNSSIE